MVINYKCLFFGVYLFFFHLSLFLKHTLFVLYTSCHCHDLHPCNLSYTDQLTLCIVNMRINIHLMFCLPSISVYISVFNQLDAQNLFHDKLLFHVSTCFEHMYLSSGG